MAAALFAVSPYIYGQGNLNQRRGFPADSKIIKVLPQFLDKKGRHTLSPSLYERDAYQYFLRKHPKDRYGLRLAIQWKARNIDWDRLTIRAEFRGAVGNDLHTTVVEEPLRKEGWFGNWTECRLTGDKFAGFGELIAWHVTILEDNRPIAQEESFLWSGIVSDEPTGK